MSDNFDITKAIKQNALNQKQEKKIEKYSDAELEIEYEIKEKEAKIINNIHIGNHKVKNAIIDFSSAGFTLEQFQNSKNDFFGIFKGVIKLQDRIIDSLYKKTFELCTNWEEVDDDGNQITLEYVKNHISIAFLKIYNDSAEILATIDTDGDDENDGRRLLGEHFIGAFIKPDDIEIDWSLS